MLSSQPGDKLIVVEGIYSMLGDTAPLREIAAVKRETGAWLLVDEAHSLGVLGERGRGLAEAEGVEADVDFVVGTFSKSLGAIGGFCASDLPDFDVLRITSRAYMFTASLPPSIVASVAQGIEAMERRPELRARLAENGRRLHAGLAAAGFPLGAEPGPILSLPMPDREAAIAVLERAAGGGRLHQPRSRLGDAGRPAAAAHERQRGAQRGADRLRGRRDRARREGAWRCWTAPTAAAAAAE